MNEQLLFDKLRYVDRLTKAGIPEDQARAHADAMDEALRESVATKTDVTLVRQDIQIAIRNLTIRTGSIVAAGVAILAAIKFFG